MVEVWVRSEGWPKRSHPKSCEKGQWKAIDDECASKATERCWWAAGGKQWNWTCCARNKQQQCEHATTMGPTYKVSATALKHQTEPEWQWNETKRNCSLTTWQIQCKPVQQLQILIESSVQQLNERAQRRRATERAWRRRRDQQETETLHSGNVESGIWKLKPKPKCKSRQQCELKRIFIAQLCSGGGWAALRRSLCPLPVAVVLLISLLLPAASSCVRVSLGSYGTNGCQILGHWLAISSYLTLVVHTTWAAAVEAVAIFPILESWRNEWDANEKRYH